MITKGEWKVNQEGNHFAIRSSEDLCPISETRHCTNIDRANAQLIAAAPDLYEALKDVLREYNTDPNDDKFYKACYEARQALAKAKVSNGSK